MHSIKLSEIVTIVKPEYVFLKIKPNNSIRNNGTHKIARTISSLYKNVIQSIKREEQKLIHIMGKKIFVPTKFSFHQNAKVSYYVYMEKKKVEFYFIIPKQYLSLIKEKMSDSWSNVTIQEVSELPTFEHDATKYQLYYRKEDGLSLAVDRRNNDLLHSNLNVVEVLEEGDKVGILYNFLPASQHGWKHSHRHTIEKVKNHKPVERNKLGFAYIAKYVLSVVDGLVTTISEAVSGKKTSIMQDDNNILVSLLERLNGGKRVNEWSVKKGNAPVIPTQVVLFSESENKLRERNAAISLAQSFDALHDDNELIYKPLRRNFALTDYSVGAERSKFSDEEAQNFISLAGRDILEKYNFIEKVESLEVMIPEDLREGVMCIGENIYRGTRTKAYLSNDENYRNLLTLLIGPSRSGKSTLISNLVTDAISNGQCAIIFDFIETCNLSDEIASLFPKEKILEIRCDDLSKMQGLGYNEVGYTENTFNQYENAKIQTANMLALVNAINPDESRLSPKMERYLESAALVVFINNGSFKDVFDVLLNHKHRENLLRKVPSNQHSNLEEYVDSLHELDEYDKQDVLVGTKIGNIIGIIDRLNILKRNSYMELMLKKDTSNNVDLSKEIQKNQLIVIRMPETMFSTPSEKDICSMFWMSKIWLSLLVRADRIRDKSKRTPCLLVVDEIYQVEHTEKFVKSKLSQIGKFCMKPLLSAHYINQLRHMREELRAANTSYVLISGSDSRNFSELKSELSPPFSEEDLINLPRYQAMCLIRAKNSYAKFITKLPGKVEDRLNKEINNGEG